MLFYEHTATLDFVQRVALVPIPQRGSSSHDLVVRCASLLLLRVTAQAWMSNTNEQLRLSCAEVWNRWVTSWILSPQAHRVQVPHEDGFWGVKRGSKYPLGPGKWSSQMSMEQQFFAGGCLSAAEAHAHVFAIPLMSSLRNMEALPDPNDCFRFFDSTQVNSMRAIPANN